MNRRVRFPWALALGLLLAIACFGIWILH
jgi:Biotin-requiring enzyme